MISKRAAIFLVSSVNQVFYSVDDFRDTQTNDFISPPTINQLNEDEELEPEEVEDELEKGTLKMKLLFTGLMLMNKIVFIITWLIG